jgi:hypothetical protein
MGQDIGNKVGIRAAHTSVLSGNTLAQKRFFVFEMVNKELGYC